MRGMSLWMAQRGDRKALPCRSSGCLYSVGLDKRDSENILDLVLDPGTHPLGFIVASSES